MRLFTGLSLGIEQLRRIGEILAELKPTGDLRWSPTGNLHITTAFLGSWDETQLPNVQSALACVPWPGPIPVSLTGFGYFPNPHHPNSLFLAVKPAPALLALAADTEGTLTALGCRRETRRYMPHVTLARLAGENITQLRFKTASMHHLFPLPVFEATAFHLYQSRQTPDGSVYEILATFPSVEATL